VGVKANEDYGNQFFVVNATDLCDALLQAKRLFPQQTLGQPPTADWLVENCGGNDLKFKFNNAWPAEDICFICAFRVPCEMQYWDSSKIISFYKDKNVEDNWSN